MRHSSAREADGRGIGFYLVALIMLAVVPLVIIAGVLVVRQGRLQRDAFERSLVQTALALSVAVDRQLASYRVMLDTLAQSDHLRQGRIDAFHAFSARVAADHGAFFVSLFDSDGRQIFNTLRPPGEPLPSPFKDPRVGGEGPDRPPVGDPSALKRVLETGQPVNSDLLYGLVAGRLIFTMNVPVLRDGKVAYVLNAAFTPDVMTKLLLDNPQFSGVPAVIYDRRGFIVGRWKDADKFAGQRIRGYELTQARRANSGVGTGTTLEGIEVHFSYARSPNTGWGVNVGIERAMTERAARTTWIVGGALAAAGLILGVLLALSVAARLRRSITGLAGSAARNQPPQVEGLRTREIAQLARALGDAAQARESQVQERESRLVAEARKAEAEDANRMKDHFIAVLSHELRNPLAPIRNSVELLRALRKRDDAASFDQIVDMLDRQSGQLTRLVNDLLDVSRISSGRIELHRERIDLRLVARHAIETALPALEARGHRLVRAIPDQPVEVSGDFARLSQVVSNLLDNAVKFTPGGGEIALSIRREGADAVLSVRDDGRGIDPAVRPHLFTPFSRAESASHRSAGGLGLGLSVAKALVELHGGAIEARDNADGKGSEFVFRIPLLAAAPAEAPAFAPAAPAASPRRVLVVDDNVDAATSLGLLLRTLGHEARFAEGGERALEMAREFHPDIVLLDIGMPGLDGYEVAKRLRAQETDRRLKVVAVTGWGQEADHARSRAAGFDLHLVKPVDLHELSRALA